MRNVAERTFHHFASVFSDIMDQKQSVNVFIKKILDLEAGSAYQGNILGTSTPPAVGAAWDMLGNKVSEKYIHVLSFAKES